MQSTPAFLTERALPRRETLFEQVSRAVADCIRRGDWKPGDMLPNEVELAAAFKVSQGTMRRALGLLVQRGVLVRHQGRGSFVAEFTQTQKSLYDRYISLEPDEGAAVEPSPTRSELVTFEKTAAPLHVSSSLMLDPALSLIHAVRSLMNSAGLVTWDELWLHPVDFAAITAENLAHHDEKMLYAFYQRACGVTIVESGETARAVLMPESICRRFALKSPLPVIEVERVSCTYNSRPVEFRRQLCITEHYHYRLSAR